MLKTVAQGATTGVGARFSRFKRATCAADIRCTEVWQQLLCEFEADGQPRRVLIVCSGSSSPLPAGVHAHDD